MRRLPDWAWLAGIVIASILVRAWLGSRMPAPFIFTDELQYQENARSLAAGNGLHVRDQSYGIVSVLYPLLIAPAYLLFDSLPDAYSAAKTINAVVMSLAALPAYALARRLLPSGWSLLAALFAIAMPSLAYTGTLMSENAFYPAFLLAAWALQRALEEPSLSRHVLLLAACGAVTLVRVQGLAVLLGALTAPALLRLVAGRPLRPWAPLYGIVAAGAVVVTSAQLARGASLASLFGAYQVVGEGSYDLVDVLRFLFWHVAELDLYVGVVPLAAFVLLAARVRVLDAPAQAFVVATVALAGWTLLVVAAFASRFADAIEERNMFVLGALLLIGLLVWIERGAVRPRVTAVTAAVVLAGLPALIPYERFLQLKVRSDTLMIVPLWNVQDSVTLPRLDDVVLVGGLAAGVAFLLVPRRFVLVLPAAVLLYFALAIHPIHAGPHGMERAAESARFEGIRVERRDWIDRAVGRDAEVAALWTGFAHHYTVMQNEFFSRSVGPVYTIGGAMPGGFPEVAVTVDKETGEVRRGDGSVVDAEYALVDGSIDLAGRPVARDPLRGLTLYRTSGPLVSTTSVSGIYNDQWSGPEVSYRRVRCAGGTLTVTLEGDPGLFPEPQQVTATSIGRRGDRTVQRVSFIRVEPNEPAYLRVRLVPDRGVCTVRFTISPTRIPGPHDNRELGTHFRAFDYKAP